MGDVMKRKVVKHGPSTFIISLPSRWVKKYSISKGDELEVEESENTVLISTEKGKKVGSVSVDVTDFDRSSLMHLIRCLYIQGYDEISLNFMKQSIDHYRQDKKRTSVSVIHEALNRLSGIEIIQQRKNSCILKALSEISLSEFDNFLRRVFLLLIDMYKDLVIGAENNDKNMLLTIKEKRNTIIKFLNLCMRVLNKRGYSDSKKTLMIYSILLMLDKISDNIRDLGRIILVLNPKLSEKSKSIFLNVKTCIEECYKLFYKFDNKKIVLISRLRENMFNDISNVSNDISKDELTCVLHLAQIPELIVTMNEFRMSLEY